MSQNNQTRGEESGTRGAQPRHRFHVVAIDSKAYHLRGSHATAQEAADATYKANKQSRSFSFVMRDGTTGKRYSVMELVYAELVSDSLLDSYDRISLRQHKAEQTQEAA